jgi:integrase
VPTFDLAACRLGEPQPDGLRAALLLRGDAGRLGRGEMPEMIPYARAPRRLPVVLSGEEMVRFLEVVPGLKPRVALVTTYAAGLRLPEVVALQRADIDSTSIVR